MALLKNLSVCLLTGILANTLFAATIETVPVGNPGNAGELSGMGWGGDEPGRICGSVGYMYNIGKYEVTAGQYTTFLNAVAGVDMYSLYHTAMSSNRGCGITRSGGGTAGSPYIYSVASEFANRPVNFVSYWDSCRFANWLHHGQPTGAQGADTTETGAYTLDGYNGPDGRTIQRNANWKWAVTSEDEWYKAAYHQNDGVTGNYFDYPTSSNTAPGRDLADASGNNANYFTGSDPYPIDSGKYTTVAGEFQNSHSPYGTFDQGGNVWEWNEAVRFYSYGWSRGVRGGSCDPNDGPTLHAYSRHFNLLLNERADIGFRVSELPEPATVTLLSLSTLSLIRRRRTSVYTNERIDLLPRH